MKIMKFLLILLSSLLLMMSCSSITIKHDFDPGYDFSQFKTFRLAAGKEINPDDELQRHPLIAKRVFIAIDKELKEKGLTEAKDDENCDIVILAHAGTKEKTEVTQTGGVYMGTGYGPGYRRGYGGWYDPWWGTGGASTTTVSQYTEATLVVDIISWKDKKLAWRGMATGVVRDNQDGQEQQERLYHIISKIFSNYPPENR
jgi:hypothetical protein